MGKFDREIMEATSERKVTEDWQAFMNLADKMQRATFEECRDASRMMMRRLKERNPLAVSYSITLLHALVENGGPEFRKAVLCRDNFATIRQVLKSQLPEKVKQNMRTNLLEWQKDFGSQAQFRIVNDWVQDLRREGLVSSSAGTGATTAFSSVPATAAATTTASSNFLSPNTSAGTGARTREAEMQYEADLARAIKESLNAASTPQQQQQQPSYAPAPTQRKQRTGQPVKVLYDFEGSEENELSLNAGDIITVTDKSDPNWWQGVSRTGDEGFFPSSFVSFDLNAEVVPEVRAAQPDGADVQKEEDEQQHVDEEEEEEDVDVVEEVRPAKTKAKAKSKQSRSSKKHQGQAAAADTTQQQTAATSAVDSALFDRFLELVVSTRPGDHTHDAEMDDLEKQCDAAITGVTERVDDYDRRLARVNQVLEKYALVNALSTRLMAQDPGMARVTRPPHQLGVAMHPSQAHAPPPSLPPHAQQGRGGYPMQHHTALAPHHPQQQQPYQPGMPAPSQQDGYGAPPMGPRPPVPPQMTAHQQQHHQHHQQQQHPGQAQPQQHRPPQPPFQAHQPGKQGPPASFPPSSQQQPPPQLPPQQQQQQYPYPPPMSQPPPPQGATPAYRPPPGHFAPPPHQQQQQQGWMPSSVA
ncbi:hypothetical protein PTSG_05883 [Salpingoeca rosetta]|uniref:Class E vacuolar protein-sorting machinery protein hse1 n=1 Tax=Salpingoeca rosetta (strain ATCC 50818 / BSB-021) TaxID=946362 RepID=F2UD24_SALR5|nr:uncharacterized protein PTSG_05883 [Salpingoeca rosetta]EGD74519.1 hypothetical protein PTSG_05883 [Salpingoeca rosetta]|eukprot:XP_004992776.1 hypothetical protein PTSG_05883 [Salpingoeca rosetta]